MRGLRPPEKGAFDKIGARSGAQNFEELTQKSVTF